MLYGLLGPIASEPWWHSRVVLDERERARERERHTQTQTQRETEMDRERERNICRHRGPEKGDREKADPSGGSCNWVEDDDERMPSS